WRTTGPGEEVAEPGRTHGGAAGLVPTPSVMRPTHRPSGILSVVDTTVGPVPRVLLRDGSADGARPALPCSEAMPASAGDAGRYQLLGEIARGGMGVVLEGRDVDVGHDVDVDRDVAVSGHTLLAPIDPTAHRRLPLTRGWPLIDSGTATSAKEGQPAYPV